MTDSGAPPVGACWGGANGKFESDTPTWYDKNVCSRSLERAVRTNKSSNSERFQPVAEHESCCASPRALRKGSASIRTPPSARALQAVCALVHRTDSFTVYGALPDISAEQPFEQPPVRRVAEGHEGLRSVPTRTSPFRLLGPWSRRRGTSSGAATWPVPPNQKNTPLSTRSCDSSFLPLPGPSLKQD
jgi:hypothetical protein